MKFIRRFAIAIATFTAGIICVAFWSAYVGQQHQSLGVFAWRNVFKSQPIIEEQANCPLHLINPRFYSYMSIGSSVETVLEFDAKNVNSKPIHSFMLSYYSSDQLDTGSLGFQPETILQSEQTEKIKISSRGKDKVTISIDFVQFEDGDIWFAEPTKSTVKQEGLQAGSKAAVTYLRKILRSDGVDGVMNVLPHLPAEVEPS